MPVRSCSCSWAWNSALSAVVGHYVCVVRRPRCVATHIARGFLPMFVQYFIRRPTNGLAPARTGSCAISFHFRCRNNNGFCLSGNTQGLQTAEVNERKQGSKHYVNRGRQSMLCLTPGRGNPIQCLVVTGDRTDPHQLGFRF
jgi:hypothetical protein